MTHNKFAFIWEKIGLLRFSQFPWRFLSLAVFSASLLGGALISLLNLRYRFLAMVIILISTVFLNLPYFKVDRYFQITDQEKLSGAEFEKQQYAGLLDYLPKTATEPREPAPQNPVVLSGKAEVENFNKKSNAFTFGVHVQENTSIEVPVFDFPVWKVKVSGQEFVHSHKNYLGRIILDLKKGNYQIEAMLTNTPIRNLANAVTIFSVAILVALIAKTLNCKIKRK